MIKSTENIKKEIQIVVDIYKSADFTNAELLCKKIIENYPKNAFLYNLLGLIFSGQQKANEAIACYERCINLDPKFAMAYNNLGLIFFNNNTLINEAINLWDKKVSISTIKMENFQSNIVEYHMENDSMEVLNNKIFIRIGSNNQFRISILIKRSMCIL